MSKLNLNPRASSQSSSSTGSSGIRAWQGTRVRYTVYARTCLAYDPQQLFTTFMFWLAALSQPHTSKKVLDAFRKELFF
jgi:hypothetical protein